MRLRRLLGLFVVFLACSPPPKPAATTTTTSVAVLASIVPDPLPSWNDGATKRAVVDFVRRTTTGGAAEYIQPDERIATFDNDGTLWQEEPLAEGAFTLSRLEELAAADSALRETEPYKAALDHDKAKIQEEGVLGLTKLVTTTHTGMTDDVYANDVRHFLGTALHPRFNVPYTALAYQPMLELLALLRSRGFVTYICSGGDVDFMRVFSQRVYGVPPDQVIGTRFEKELIVVDGKTRLLRRPKIESVNDKEGKPVGIDRAIGRRPAFAAGNVRSGGDVAMLRWAHDRVGPSFELVVEHDDPIRENAYEEPDNATLNAARAGHFTVVSMRRDWNVVFSAGLSR